MLSGERESESGTRGRRVKEENEKKEELVEGRKKIEEAKGKKGELRMGKNGKNSLLYSSRREREENLFPTIKYKNQEPEAFTWDIFSPLRSRKQAAILSLSVESKNLGMSRQKQWLECKKKGWKW